MMLHETETGIQNYTQWRTTVPRELTKRKFIELFIDLVLGKRHFFSFSSVHIFIFYATMILTLEEKSLPMHFKDGYLQIQKWKLNRYLIPRQLL